MPERHRRLGVVEATHTAIALLKDIGGQMPDETTLRDLDIQYGVGSWTSHHDISNPFFRQWHEAAHTLAASQQNAITIAIRNTFSPDGRPITVGEIRALTPEQLQERPNVGRSIATILKGIFTRPPEPNPQS